MTINIFKTEVLSGITIQRYYLVLTTQRSTYYKHNTNATLANAFILKKKNLRVAGNPFLRR